MEPVLLFRVDADSKREVASARKCWAVVTDRTLCRNQLVIGRYSVLPFYDALEAELVERGCRLVNSYAQHRWVADLDYYPLFRDVTPETWSDQEFAAVDEDGPFVLKGRTNSFKHQWQSLMFARDKADALRKADVLREHQVIAQQGLIFRRYVPLETFEHTASGLPVTNEWRFFFYRGRVVAHGYYWATVATAARRARIDDAGIAFARRCGERAAPHITFFVADVARTARGDWILIELNDAQTSGLSMIDPDHFYKNLRDLAVSG